MTKRLFPTIKPSNYEISLKPSLNNFTFEGKEKIEFQLKKATNTLVFHAFEISISAVTLQNGKNTLTPTISYDKEERTVTFKFDKTLSPGKKELKLEFEGILTDKMMGFYRSKYIKDGEDRYIATTHFEEIGARQAFVCIDEPEAKAIFHITLIVNKNLTAISNTLEEKVTEEGDWKHITFFPTPVMSTYTLVFIVGEFESIEKKAENGVLVRIFVTPGKKHLATFALETAAKMLPFYEKYFGIEYPLPKLDFIAIPDFNAGAMENWGGVTAREAALLIDEEKSAAVNKQWVANVIAHETSHMWFGDLVTLKWWTYLWLNEGFASYMEYLAVDELFPQWNVWEQFAVLDHNRALGLDSLENTHPVETEITDIYKLAENFDEISYSKGASVIYMLVSFMGEKDFRKGIQAYLKKYAYKNATSDNLWKILEQTSGKPIKNIMHSFIKEPGHPILLVEEKDSDLEITQKRFFLSPVFAKNTSFVWDIPFSITSNKSKSEFLMKGKYMSISSKNYEWIKLNSDETSYVRSIYSPQLYKRLQSPIEKKELSSNDRMGIVRDAFDAAEAGLLPTSFALELAKSYKNEDSYIVWATLAGKLSKVATLLSSTEMAESFSQYAQEIFQRIVQKIGWEKKPIDTHNDILLRSLVLHASGKYDNRQVIEKAQRLFSDFITDGKAIDNDIRSVVYQLVAKDSSEKDFSTFEKMYKEESLHEEKNRISSALVAFENPALLRKALEFSISEHVRTQDIFRFVLLAFANENGKDITWEFVKENWEYLYKKHKGLLGLNHLIEGAGSFTTLEKKKDIETFFNKHKAADMERSISQVLEQIEANTIWLERDKEDIAEFLNKR